MKQRKPIPAWVRKIAERYVPFADAASAELPLPRLLRLALFQAVIGMTLALLVGTLNRVMIVELQVPSWWVAVAVAVPMVFAPLRALIGYRSDTYPSVLGLRRIPYLWSGTLTLFGGLAIMPFALLLLSEPSPETLWLGRIGAALAFVLVGAGIQITQTAGIALANDLSTADKQPRVVALLYTMLLLGMILSSAVFGWLLQSFTPSRLIQVVQSCAVLVLVLNLVALWKQEARSERRGARQAGGFAQSLRSLMAIEQMKRFLWTVGLGTCAFSMQDIILEPYGAEVLGLDVGSTSGLTAIGAAGSLVAFWISAKWLNQGLHACRLASAGVLIGLPAFAMVIFSAPLASVPLFRTGVMLIGFGGGLFSVGMLVMAMSFPNKSHSGLVLGAWGAVQGVAAGVAIAVGGLIRDVVSQLAQSGLLGESLQGKVTGYSFVYHVEIYLLFVVLIALGPLLRRSQDIAPVQGARFGLAEFPT
jgi:BCD family chlorophyll transporter-like MFS transporter